MAHGLISLTSGRRGEDGASGRSGVIVRNVVGILHDHTSLWYRQAVAHLPVQRLDAVSGRLRHPARFSLRLLSHEVVDPQGLWRMAGQDEDLDHQLLPLARCAGCYGVHDTHTPSKTMYDARPRDCGAAPSRPAG